MRKIKVFKNKDYKIIFDMTTGTEILTGINGKADPFSLELPSLLDVGIMGHCKRKCPFCYQGHEDKRNMTLDDFKTIIDQTKHHVNQIALGGRGDPNKHEQFEQILKYCRKNNIVPNYTTSGFELTDREVEISKLCGAVAVSDYQEEFSYEAIRKLTNAGIKTNIHKIFSIVSYQECIEILYGYNPWRQNMISKGGIIYNIDLSKINAVIFLLFKQQGAGKNVDMRPKPHQIKLFSDLIVQSKAQCKVGMDSCLVNHVLKYSTMTQAQRMCVDTCEGARMSAYISPDMKFMPCSFANKNSAIDLTKTNLKEVWTNGPCFLDFRNTLFKTPASCPIEL